MTDMLSYDEIVQALNRAQASASPAEVHGMICGFICAGTEMDGKSWFDLIFGNRQLSRDALEQNRSLLLNLYRKSSEGLQNFEFDFVLLLPDDDADLAVRAEALSHWCQGFVIAFERSGVLRGQDISQDAREAMEHFLEIAKLDYGAISVSEEDERAYVEVMEYVRVAVMMIYTEIANAQGPGAGSNTHKHLH